MHPVTNNITRSELQNRIEQHIGIRDAAVVLQSIPQGCVPILKPERRVFVVMVPTLEIKIDRLPVPYLIQDFNAWAAPQKFALRYYFKLFGSNCLVQKVGECTKDVHCTESAVFRECVITVYCRTLWRQITAAARIVRFVRPAMTKQRPRSNSLPPLCHTPQLETGVHALNVTVVPVRKHSLSRSYKNSVVQHSLEYFARNHLNPRAVLMFGFPGSGKNHLLKKRPRVEHVTIDVDQCLEYMPAFWKGIVEQPDHDWVFDMRDEAHLVAQQMLDIVLKQRMHFVWNGTGRSLEFYTTLMKRLHSKGYVVELCGVYARASTARTRMKERARPVPKRVLVDAMDSVHKNFRRLAPQADYARVWSNDDSENGPSVIWDKYQGILDANAWRTWECPSPLPVSPRRFHVRVWDTSQALGGLSLPPLLTDKRPRSGSM